MTNKHQTATTSPTYEAPASVVHRSVGDDIVLLDLDSGTYFTLTGTGAEMWKHLCAGQTTAQMASTLLAEYDIDAVTLNRDIDALIEQLTGAGLIQPYS